MQLSFTEKHSMHYTIYTKKEKPAHLEKAKAKMKSGTGSFRSYAIAAGIGSSTFYKWRHAYGYFENDEEKNEPSCAFANLGKPLPQQPSEEQEKLVVYFYGSKIEISLPNSLLLELLKGIRIEGFI
jgi:hypothetical protein